MELTTFEKIIAFIPITLLVLFFIHKWWYGSPNKEEVLESKITVSFEQSYCSGDLYWTIVVLLIDGVSMESKREWFRHSDDIEPVSKIHIDEWLEKTIKELKLKEKLIRNRRKLKEDLKENHKDYQIIISQEEDKNGTD